MIWWSRETLNGGGHGESIPQQPGDLAGGDRPAHVKPLHKVATKSAQLREMERCLDALADHLKRQRV